MTNPSKALWRDEPGGAPRARTWVRFLMQRPTTNSPFCSRKMKMMKNSQVAMKVLRGRKVKLLWMKWMTCNLILHQMTKMTRALMRRRMS
ncbi:signal transducer [Histoplasma capsulatum]|uniref:Signal transducer n=1 Tax=Ajellomyces capsulatus TaxID=5037 RepID=A0A8A1LZP8_AJECA|nr:signal transducer [Histoplasma capsulatum]